MPHDQRHAEPRVEARPLAPRQADAVIAEEHHDGVFAQAGLLELPQPLADPAIHGGDVVVGPRDRLAHLGRVGIEGGQRHGVATHHLRAAAGLGKRLAFVGALVVEDREKRPVGRTVSPVGAVTRLVPHGHRLFELVVLLRVVGAGIAGRPQLLGKATDERRRHSLVARNVAVGVGVAGGRIGAGGVVPHVHRADAGAEHARDQRRAGRGADRRRGEGVVVHDALPGEPVEVGRGHGAIAVGSDPRAHVLDGEPHDVRPLWVALGRGPVAGPRPLERYRHGPARKLSHGPIGGHDRKPRPALERDRLLGEVEAGDAVAVGPLPLVGHVVGVGVGSDRDFVAEAVLVVAGPGERAARHGIRSGFFVERVPPAAIDRVDERR